ncbi:hypothetical protein, partial [Burkholderia pseudomallei]|uniref:hypothetical protein n=1 Tax=Burkholderia pseudomallei TaxID=28450 RepID=UPI0021F73924
FERLSARQRALASLASLASLAPLAPLTPRARRAASRSARRSPSLRLLCSPAFTRDPLPLSPHSQTRFNIIVQTMRQVCRVFLGYFHSRWRELSPFSAQHVFSKVRLSSPARFPDVDAAVFPVRWGKFRWRC